MSKKIIIIEDQLILNDMLKKTLSSSFEVVATSDDASTMLNLCDKYSPDLVLTDVCTKNNSSGISNGKKVKDKYGNKIKVLAITGIPEVSFLNEAKAANLDGFIYKNIESDALLVFITQVLNGYKLFPDNVDYNDDNKCFKDLTEKELKILTLLCSGYEREHIAKKLNITTGTLKNYISNILNKLGFESISKLLVFCIGNGYIIPELDK